MSGGELVVLDRNGRDVKRYSLPDGLATLGSDPACDICVMLSSVSSHHATIVVHANQTIIRNVGDGDTLVNGAKISVAALDHNDIITLGGRSLRWEYTIPSGKRTRQIQPVFLSNAGAAGGRRRRAGRWGSAGVGGPGGADRAVQLAIEMSHRASMPASSGGKQVAVVQPQRRDNSNAHSVSEKNVQIQPQSSKRSRNSNMESSLGEEERSKRKSVGKTNCRSTTLQGTTKATLWIESRKTSPRKSPRTVNTVPRTVHTVPRTVHTVPRTVHTVPRTVHAAPRGKGTPLRLAVLRRARTAHNFTLTKIEEPLKIDETKQAAIMLMTGHTAKCKLVASKPKTPSYVLKKPSPVRKSPRANSSTSARPRRSHQPRTPLPSRAGFNSTGNETLTDQNPSTEISHTGTENITVRRSNTLRRSGQRNPQKSPLQRNPKKSALKDPKKLSRKTETIKFDLSNLENSSQECSEVITVTDTMETDQLTLRYSDSPTSTTSTSPSPRQPIHSRSSRILEKSIGFPMSLSPRSTVQLDSPSTRKSLRGSLIVQRALDMSTENTTRPNATDSTNETASIASAFKTHTLSPRPATNMESYSIVDLVSIDSNESRSASLYNSVTSEDITSFGTPQNSVERKTRSLLDPTLLGSSTPYVAKTPRTSNYTQNITRSTRSRSNLDISQQSNNTITDLTSTRRSKSLSTPVNTQKHISVNSTKITRPSRSRSRLNDSDLMLIDENESDASPKSSKRINRTAKSIPQDSTIQKESFNCTDAGDVTSTDQGHITPENRHSPQDIGTPVLRIQSLLDASQNSFTSQNSSTKSVRSSKRKTIGLINETKKKSPSFRSKSLNTSARKTKLNLSKNVLSSDISDEGAWQPDNEEVVTPKSAVKLIPEVVKNKHSTAKKPQSKRTIIDHLNQSDIVKQLFNSPVKRKLSQSMTEFSRKRLFDDDDDGTLAKRLTRNTVAYIPLTSEDSILDRTQAITPELFVSPMNTPRHSPNTSGIKRLFAKTSPENRLSDFSGVKVLFQNPRPRRSVKNDLTNVSGVKLIFAKSSENQLSDVNVKSVFAKSPRNDLRRVSGVKTMFRQQKECGEPENDLRDVRGVRELFKNAPTNDLRNVSGVKRTFQNRSPRNDLTDLRGVRRMFRRQGQVAECDHSGLAELFEEPQRDADRSFDRLVGKPQIKSVYSKSFSSRSTEKQRQRSTKTLHCSIEEITNNVEGWLESELQRRANREPSGNVSLRRELRRLATATAEGGTPLRAGRVRSSTAAAVAEGEARRGGGGGSALLLPPKKRSVGEARERSRLPLKKRRVMHSTPVKHNVTMNPPDLSRVSPIQALGTSRLGDVVTPRRHGSTHRSIVQAKEDSTHHTKTETIKDKAVISNSEIKVSPRKTRAKGKATKMSPTTRTTRTRASNKPALIIKKKAPSLTPRKSENCKTTIKKNIIDINENKHVSPKKISQKQKQIQLDVVSSTPKRNTRAKALKTGVTVNKPSPVMKPQASKKVTFKHSNVPEKVETVKENNVKAKRTRNTTPSSESPTEPRALRGKTLSETQTQSNNKKSKSKKVITNDVKEKPVGRKSRKNIAQPEDNEEPIKDKPVKRNRRTKSPDNEVNEVRTMRNRRRGQADDVQDVLSDVKKTSGKAKTQINQESIQSTSTGSSRQKKIQNTVTTEIKTRKQRTVVQEPEPVKATRGRKKIVKVTEIETSTDKKKKIVVKGSKIENGINKQESDGTVAGTSRTTRSRKVVEHLPSARSNKRKQVGEKTSTTVVESEPEAKRKRGNNSKTTSIIKESSKKQVSAAAAAAAPPGRATRGAAKQNEQTEVRTLRARGRAR